MGRDCEKCDSWQADYSALLYDKKELLEALIKIRAVAGSAMDFGNNDDAVQKCYVIARDAVGESCMKEVVQETEKLGGYKHQKGTTP